MSKPLKLCQLRTDWKVAVGSQPIGPITPDSWSIEEEIERFAVVRRMTMVLSTKLAIRASLLEGRVVRMQIRGRSPLEFRIQGITENDKTGTTTVKGSGWESDLTDKNYLVHELDANGVLTLAPIDAGKTPSTALTDRVLAVAPSYWALGTVTPTTMYDVEHKPGTTPWEAGLSIADAAVRRTMIQYELEATEDLVAGKIKLHLRVAGGTAEVLEVKPTRSLLSLVTQTERREQTTRAWPVGANGAHCGKNRWLVAAVDTGADTVDLDDLAGGPGPVQEAGQYTPSATHPGETRYLVPEGGAAQEIAATSLVSATRSRFAVVDASLFTVGSYARIALNSSGHELGFVDCKADRDTYGIKNGVLQLPLDDGFNLLAQQNPSFASYAAEPPAGWTVSGDGAAHYAESTAAGTWLTSGRSLHHLGTGVNIYRSAGISVVVPTGGAYYTWAIWIRVEEQNLAKNSGWYGEANGNAVIALDPNAPPRVDLQQFFGKGFQKSTMSALLPAGTWTIKVVVFGGIEFYLDAVQMSEGKSIEQFAAGSNPAAMIQECNRHLYLDNAKRPSRTLSLSLADLHQLNGTTWPYDAINLGGSFRLSSSLLAVPETPRFMRLSWGSEAPLVPKVVVGTRNRAISSVVSQSSGSLGGTPGGPLAGGGTVVGQNPPTPGSGGSTPPPDGGSTPPPPAPTWGPLPGAEIWVEADQGLGVPTDGDPISTWADMSGNGNDLTNAGGSVRPTWKDDPDGDGLPLVRFDGVDDILAKTGLTAYTGSDLTAYFVVRHARQGSAATPMFAYWGGASLASGNNVSLEASVNTSSGALRVRRGSTASYDASPLVSGLATAAVAGDYLWRVVAIRFSMLLGRYVLSICGEVSVGHDFAATAQAFNFSRFTLGAGDQTLGEATSWIKGDVRAAGYYLAAHTDDQVRFMVQGLAQKWKVGIVV